MTTKVTGLEQLIEQTKLDIANLETEIQDRERQGIHTEEDEIDPVMRLKGLRVILNSYEAVVKSGE